MPNLHFQYEIDGEDLTQAGDASSQMKLALKRLGLPAETIRKASICMYEGEINMVIHADGGEATVDVDMNAITIRLQDRGPGIPNVQRAMEAGFSTASSSARDLGFGAGMGLPNMKRYSDEMSVSTQMGVGTCVEMKINI